MLSSQLQAAKHTCNALAQPTCDNVPVCEPGDAKDPVLVALQAAICCWAAVCGTVLKPGCRTAPSSSSGTPQEAALSSTQPCRHQRPSGAACHQHHHRHCQWPLSAGPHKHSQWLQHTAGLPRPGLLASAHSGPITGTVSGCSSRQAHRKLCQWPQLGLPQMLSVAAAHGRLTTSVVNGRSWGGVSQAQSASPRDQIWQSLGLSPPEASRPPSGLVARQWMPQLSRLL